MKPEKLLKRAILVFALIMFIGASFVSLRPTHLTSQKNLHKTGRSEFAESSKKSDDKKVDGDETNRFLKPIVKYINKSVEKVLEVHMK